MLKLTLKLLIALIIASSCAPEKEVYLFTYFKGNGEDGLHLAYSKDGYKWSSLNDDEPFLAPEVGESVLMRDPCIIQTNDGVFHMVWTPGWNEKGIGYANSKDLVNWSKQKYIPVMMHEPTTLNAWAPEITYDEKSKQFIIYWASTIPEKFTETKGSGGNKYNHRMYYVTSKDCKTFSKTKLFYDDGFNVIDGTILKQKNEYIMFLKDETKLPVAQKNIRIATANNIEGPYSSAGKPITGNYWCEGPTCAKIGDKYIVYFDKYTKHTYGAVESTDLKNWTDVSDKVKFPKGTRHGTFFKIKGKFARNFINKFHKLSE